MIYVTSSGLDQTAPLDWVPPGCMLVNNRGTHGPKAGEWGLMAILMLANLIPRHVTFQRERRWQKAYSSGLAGQTLVSIGVGSLASQTLRHVRGLGMHVIGVRAHERPAPRLRRGRAGRAPGRGAAARRPPADRLPVQRLDARPRLPRAPRAPAPRGRRREHGARRHRRPGRAVRHARCRAAVGRRPRRRHARAAASRLTGLDDAEPDRHAARLGRRSRHLHATLHRHLLREPARLARWRAAPEPRDDGRGAAPAGACRVSPASGTRGRSSRSGAPVGSGPRGSGRRRARSAGACARRAPRPGRCPGPARPEPRHGAPAA